MGTLVFTLVVMAVTVAFRVFSQRKPLATEPRVSIATNPDLDWFYPPKDPNDVAGWDRYWDDRVSHKIVGYTDLFVQDDALLALARARGYQTVLCVGCGVSQEPRALAHAGLQVTALDVSPRAIELVLQLVAPNEFLERLIGEANPRPGGHVDYLAGDLRDPKVCGGPFDIVIERCTVQVFRDADREQALESVAGRLSRTGLLLSQWHLGGWRPHQPRIHGGEAWLATQGFEIRHEVPPPDTAPRPIGRLACLLTTSG